jgi:Raf kinase inhibitor-like YbhB/YbcL family protein
MKGIVVTLLAVAVLFTACLAKDKPGAPPKGDKTMALTITSPVFAEGGMIPKKFTCDDADVSPALEIKGVPASAKSLALIADDPDAPVGIWVHWVLYNLPPDTKKLDEAMPKDTTLKNGARQGVTDFGSPGYGGPCPPGGTHRYYFKVYALDTMLTVTGKATKKDLEAAMKGHILAEGQLMGKYARQR